MSKPPTQKVPSKQDAAKFHAELAALQSAYCDIFKLWRACPFTRCRRERVCRGDRNKCLKRGTKNMPRDVQWLARQEIMTAAPKNAGPVARELRETLPGELWV
jgi:hypothetical protein